jgi:hypothetical protein
MSRSGRWRRPITAAAHNMRLVALLSLLRVMIVAFAIAISTQAGARSQPGAGVTDEWVALASTSAADVLTAARATTLYQEVATHPQTLLGQAVRAGSLGTPQLVHVFHPLPGMHDVWVVPLLQATVPGLHAPGPQVVGMLDLDYDSAVRRVRGLVRWTFPAGRASVWATVSPTNTTDSGGGVHERDPCPDRREGTA